jgi:hypothetical protein
MKATTILTLLFLFADIEASPAVQSPDVPIRGTPEKIEVIIGTKMPSFFDGLTLLVVLGIFGSIGKFAYESTRDGTRRRSDLYDKLRERFDGDEFDPVYTALENYNYCPPEERANAEVAIRALPINIRARFAAFIEHVALVTKSGIISYRLANYEFGYYAIMCWECGPPFWDDLTDEATKQNDPDWALYRDFVRMLRLAASELKRNTSAEIAKLKF